MKNQEYIRIFYAYKGTKDIVEIFKKSNYSIRFVGGCVRDAIFKKKFNDIDFVTDALPEDSIRILRENMIKVIPTGLKHGTITAIIKETSFEITTIRSDVACDGRHAEVKFSKFFEEDAKRRDFTINSMSISTEGELFDYFKGKTDLENGLLKFVGNPNKRVEEDYLRILRFYRFYSYYGEKIDEESRNACKYFADKILNLSGERIRAEFGKILISPNAENTLHMMFKDSVLQQFLPIKTLDTSWFNRVQEFCKKHKIIKCDLRNLITLLNNNDIDLNYWIKSNIERSYIKKLIKNQTVETIDNNYLLKLLYKYKRKLYIDKIILFLTFNDKDIENKDFLKMITLAEPIFPLQGQHLIDLGFKPSAEIGKKLNELEDIWIESNFTLNKEELLKKTRK